MRIAFLLGSGASRPTLPDTADLTDKIQKGDGYAHSDGTYFKGQPLYAYLQIPDTHVPYICSFLRWLNCHVSRYYEHDLGRTANYEDLYYLVEQIHDEEAGELDNPFVAEAQRDIRPRLCECAERVAAATGSTSSIRLMAEEILNYIASVVATELRTPNDSTEHFMFLKEALDATVSDQLRVFTLNHDLLLDQFFSTRNIEVTDGFGPAINSVKYWNPRLLSDGTSRSVLLKLHGSINWFRFRTDGGDWYDERICKVPESQNNYDTTDPNGRRQRPLDDRPVMLIGTFNKMPQYSRGLFFDLFAEFRRRLTESDVLVVCGYGFGDKGINGKINEWAYGARGRRILVVHPEPDKLLATAPGAIQNKWATWREKGVLQLYEALAENIAWNDVASIIAAC
ncbi:MAG: SIR2 family protein [Gammaproteobacteria bacterium]